MITLKCSTLYCLLNVLWLSSIINFKYFTKHVIFELKIIILRRKLSFWEGNCHFEKKLYLSDKNCYFLVKNPIFIDRNYTYNICFVHYITGGGGQSPQMEGTGEVVPPHKCSPKIKIVKWKLSISWRFGIIFYKKIKNKLNIV